MRLRPSSFLVPVPSGVAYMAAPFVFWGWLAILLAQPFGCRVRFPRFALGFMGVAACEIDGIARISPLEHVGDKRLPALIRWLMTEGEARPNGCIYTYTFLAVGGKAHSTMPNVLTTWTLTKSVYGIGATGSMAVSKTVDVGSSPTCCAQPTHRLWERSSESSCGGSSFS